MADATCVSSQDFVIPWGDDWIIRFGWCPTACPELFAEPNWGLRQGPWSSSQIACNMQVTSLPSRKLSVRTKSKRRSGCPVSASLEIFGDRWSLLIVRDMMIRGFRAFKDFENSGEGIATNILSGRLRRLQAAGIIRAEAEQ